MEKTVFMQKKEMIVLLKKHKICQKCMNDS